MTKNFTDENFEKEVLETSKIKPVLVDFFADWCGPCKLQGPIIDELAEEMNEKVVIGKVNTEDAQEVSEKYGVMSIPNILVFKNGEIVENLIGLQPKENLVEILKKYL